MLDTSSLSEKIETQLKREIMSGDLSPGQRLTIDDIAVRLQVSAMPVRDAVRRLDGLGFLKVAPRRGVYVEVFDQKRFQQTMKVRIALECLAVELAAPRIPAEKISDARAQYQGAGDFFAETGDLSQLVECDNLLHDLIVSHSENPLLIELMSQLRDLIGWAHHIVAKLQPKGKVDALPEHLAILDVLIKRDVKRTQGALRAHLENTMRRTLTAWDQSPERAN